jgi:methyl-accepting chemotaxis protein
MGVSALLSFIISSRALEQSVKGNLEITADSLVTQIDMWLNERRREVRNWSENKTFITSLEGGFVGKSALKSADKYLAGLKSEYQYMDMVGLADREGVVISSDNPETKGTNVADEKFFQESMAGKACFSEVFTSKTSGNPVFVLSNPVMKADEITGVIFVVVDVEFLSQTFVKPIKIGQTGYAFIFGPDGLVVGHPDPKMILKLDIKDYGFGREMLGKEKGFMNYSLEGLDKIAVVLKDKHWGWTTVVSAGIKETYAAADTIRFYSIIITVGFVLLLIGGISYTMGRLIIKPLGKAVFVMEKLSQGNLKHKVDINTRDEIGLLSKAIDSFTSGQAEFAGLMKEIGEGNLTKDVPSRSDDDEISPAVQQMLENLRDIVGKVNRTASMIASGTNEISDSSQALSQGASEQAASLEEITSSMTQVGSQTNTNAQNAGQANQLAVLARHEAESGNERMQDMISAMSQINESSKEIAKIIKTIDDIACQTNLLALNAAVEAARAGKHGKGFAVVAQEVRNLAGRSAQAARETAELIDGSVKRVDKGSDIVNQTASALQKIVDSIVKTADLVAEIATASSEQAQGISQINTGLNQVEIVTQQNTATAEQTASASTELAGQADTLKQILSKFILKEENTVSEQPTEPRQQETALETDSKGREQTSLWMKDHPRNPESESPQKVIIKLDDDFGKY